MDSAATFSTSIRASTLGEYGITAIDAVCTEKPHAVANPAIVFRFLSPRPEARVAELVALATTTFMEKIEYFISEIHSPGGPCRGRLADLILDAHFIQRCGFIPPFRVLRSLLHRGTSGGGMSPGCEWQPFELSEDDYYQLVEALERLTPEDLKLRHRDPQIVGEIRPDYDGPDTDDYDVWAESLVHRGYLSGGPFRQTRR